MYANVCLFTFEMEFNQIYNPEHFLQQNKSNAATAGNVNFMLSQ